MRKSTLRTALVSAMCLVAPALVMATAPAGNASAPASAVRMLDPIIADSAPKLDPATPLAGEKFAVTGALTDVAGVARSFDLQIKSGSSWKKVVTAATAIDGTYSVLTSTTAATATYRILAKVSGVDPAVTTPSSTITTVADHAMVSILRDCAAPTNAGSDCSAGTATATGSVAVDSATINPVTGDTVPKHDTAAVREGRLFALQRLSGKTWTQLGAKAPEDANGNIAFSSFSLTGLSQWKASDYRIVGDVFNGAKAVTSPTVHFMPGPTTLGANVVRVTTLKNVAVTSKNKDYLGSASSSVGSAVTPSAPIQTLSLHGNSTASLAKKPYKIKFFDKQKFLGMKSDRTFILLAHFIDPAGVRDKVGLDLGAALKANLDWTPRNTYAEVFVNGEYMGNYLAVESIKIDSNRVDVDKALGIAVTIDGRSVPSGGFGFISSHKIPIIFKDPDETKPEPYNNPAEGYTPAKLAALKSRVTAFENVLYGSASVRDNPTTGWRKYLDQNASIDYYLIKEFTKDNDADMYRSIFFSWCDYTLLGTTKGVDGASKTCPPDSKFKMGPVWDFDRSAGVITGDATASSSSGWKVRGIGTTHNPNNKTHWYVQLFKDPSYLAAVQAEWNATKCSVFKPTTAVSSSDPGPVITADVAAMGPGANNEWLRWASTARRYTPKGNSFTSEINYVANWYKARFTWMDGQLDPNHTVTCP